MLGCCLWWAGRLRFPSGAYRFARTGTPAPADSALGIRPAGCASGLNVPGSPAVDRGSLMVSTSSQATVRSPGSMANPLRSMTRQVGLFRRRASTSAVRAEYTARTAPPRISATPCILSHARWVDREGGERARVEAYNPAPRRGHLKKADAVEGIGVFQVHAMGRRLSPGRDPD